MSYPGTERTVLIWLASWKSRYGKYALYTAQLGDYQIEQCLKRGLSFEEGLYACSVDRCHMVSCRVVAVDNEDGNRRLVGTTKIAN